MILAAPAFRHAPVAVHLDIGAPIAVRLRARRMAVVVLMRSRSGVRRRMRTLACVTSVRIRLRPLAAVPAMRIRLRTLASGTRMRIRMGARAATGTRT